MTPRNAIQPYSNFLNELIVHVVGTKKFIHPLQDRRTRIEDIDKQTKRLNISHGKNQIVLLVKSDQLTVEQVVNDPARRRHFDLYLGRKRILQDARVGMTFPLTKKPISLLKFEKVVPRRSPKMVTELDKNVSVVIVTHNRKDLLKRTLTTLVSQIRENDEIIVVDDGSTDNSDYMVKNMLPQARYIPMKHKGYRLSTMKNTGILAAKNNLIICLDDDCIPEPNFIERYRKNAGMGRLLLGGFDFLSKNGVVRRTRKDAPILKGSLDGGYGGNICFHREEAITVGLFNEDYNGFWGYEDTDFIMKMKESGIILKPLFTAKVKHQWHPPHPQMKEGRKRNKLLLEKKATAYRSGMFPKIRTLLLIVDQYEWAWDIAARELLEHLKGYRGVIVSARDFIEREIDTSRFDVVLAWYWIMDYRGQMLADPRVLKKLNPENTILCVAGEHIFDEGFSLQSAKDFRFIGANNSEILKILKVQAPDKEVTILSHGVDLEKFQPKPPSSEPSETFTVGWVGSTRRKSKRYAFAVEAVKGMRKIKLKVAGHVTTKYTTREFIPNEKMPAFYDSLNCLLVTSETESHPLVVYEAMASGIPVITTLVGDVSETIVDGYNGLLLPVKCNVRDIRGAIRKLKESPGFARALAVNARKTVEEKWNWNLISKQYRDFLNRFTRKFTVSMLVSRDDELLERAVASVVKQRPTEFRAYIDPITLKDYGKAEKILKAAGAKVYVQTCNPKQTSYLNHAYDVACNVHRAIMEAENKWVCWVDDDDMMFGDRRRILAKYGHADVGLIHGNVVRVYPYTTRLKTTEAIIQPRNADKCVGSGTIYNRDAFNQVQPYIHGYMKEHLETCAYWDYMIAYWIKRAGWKTTHTPEILSIQNVNLNHPPERKKLYDLWPRIADELDTISLSKMESLV